MPKPIDYTNSAENLVNPIEVKDLLDQLHLEEQTLAGLLVQLKEQSGELMDAIKEMEGIIAETNLELKGDEKKGIVGAIGEYGSYQNLESGEYGVKYRRTSISYDAPKFIEYFPNFVPVVIKSSVNEAALDGLIKGKLITIEELHNCDVIIEDFKYAFYIR